MKTYCLTNPPQHHDDIKLLQTALKTDGFYRGKIDGIFSIATGDACYKAKYTFGYLDSKLDHCGGQLLLNYLRGTTALTATMKKNRVKRGLTLTKSQEIRNEIITYALWGVQNEPAISYSQTRPMENLHNVKHLPWNTDCSEFVTTIYCWAGAPDPNGLNYNGQGYTGTMLNSGVFVPLIHAIAGDVVIWGNPPGHHTAVLIEDGTANGGNPYIVSHGSSRGPLKVSLRDESALQNRPAFFKSYIK